MGERMLPGWVKSNAESLKAEAAPFVHLTPEERAVLVARACAEALTLARSREDYARVMAWEDPLPESTRVALRRLRAEAAARRAGSEGPGR